MLKVVGWINNISNRDIVMPTDNEQPAMDGCSVSYHSTGFPGTSRHVQVETHLRFPEKIKMYRVVQKNGATLHFPKYLENY